MIILDRIGDRFRLNDNRVLEEKEVKELIRTGVIKNGSINEQGNLRIQNVMFSKNRKNNVASTCKEEEKLIGNKIRNMYKGNAINVSGYGIERLKDGTLLVTFMQRNAEMEQVSVVIDVRRNKEYLISNMERTWNLNTWGYNDLYRDYVKDQKEVIQGAIVEIEKGLFKVYIASYEVGSARYSRKKVLEAPLVYKEFKLRTALLHNCIEVIPKESKDHRYMCLIIGLDQRCCSYSHNIGAIVLNGKGNVVWSIPPVRDGGIGVNSLLLYMEESKITFGIDEHKREITLRIKNRTHKFKM